MAVRAAAVRAESRQGPGPAMLRFEDRSVLSRIVSREDKTPSPDGRGDRSQLAAGVKASSVPSGVKRYQASAGPKGIASFLVLAFGGAWTVWGIAWFFHVLNTGPGGQIVVALGAFAPALAALVVRKWVTREGFADAGLKPNLKRSWPYYLFGWLSPLLVVGVIMVLAVPFGIRPVRPLSAILVLTVTAGSLLAAPLFLGEEFGWRSYLQIRWRSHRPLQAAMLTGVVWGVFHYPLILIGFEGYENAFLGLPVFTVSAILLSIVLGWLRVTTGSVWASCVAHSAVNGIGGSLTAYLFLGTGHFLAVSYLGLLGWVPLTLLCVGITIARRVSASEGSKTSTGQPEPRPVEFSHNWTVKED